MQDFGFRLPFAFTSISLELLTGIQFSQPFLFSIWSWKVGATAQTSYSNRQIQSGLPFQAIALGLTSLPIRISFPVTLPSHTLFNTLVFDVVTEWQSINNLLEVFADMQINGNDSNDASASERNRISTTEFLTPYFVINNYSWEKKGYLWNELYSSI